MRLFYVLAVLVMISNSRCLSLTPTAGTAISHGGVIANMIRKNAVSSMVLVKNAYLEDTLSVAVAVGVSEALVDAASGLVSRGTEKAVVDSKQDLLRTDSRFISAIFRTRAIMRVVSLVIGLPWPLGVMLASMLGSFGSESAKLFGAICTEKRRQALRLHKIPGIASISSCIARIRTRLRPNCEIDSSDADIDIADGPEVLGDISMWMTYELLTSCHIPWVKDIACPTVAASVASAASAASALTVPVPVALSAPHLTLFRSHFVGALQQLMSTFVAGAVAAVLGRFVYDCFNSWKLHRSKSGASTSTTVSTVSTVSTAFIPTASASATSGAFAGVPHITTPFAISAPSPALRVHVPPPPPRLRGLPVEVPVPVPVPVGAATAAAAAAAATTLVLPVPVESEPKLELLVEPLEPVQILVPTGLHPCTGAQQRRQQRQQQQRRSRREAMDTNLPVPIEPVTVPVLVPETATTVRARVSSYARVALEGGVLFASFECILALVAMVLPAKYDIKFILASLIDHMEKSIVPIS